MQDWEYEIEVLEVESLEDGAAKSRLNELSGHGWDIVSVTPLLGLDVSPPLRGETAQTRTRAVAVVLKRPLQTGATARG